MDKLVVISADTAIEDLVEHLPASISYLSDRGIRCIRCGEPVWGTLRTAALEKGFSEAELKGFVDDLNGMLEKARPL